ncbi:Flp pilus assembly protein CpaB [Nocardioides marmorisolisilvae]|uniref:Flp pilus assembly protein CpaB n=1 Tax=Nocardioides marmorisolisilvae TaxID=1542737 RepID=A0A3N0DTY5_9ACTN|nr:Flp pilus assembly protein CpaB [Nocardioides marmorisolisilvae]RNL79087.1 Flp pilus assembly protein CpaB [Nocardioides marmorisolisilvae]
MDRRRILIVVAAVVAALGTALVFFYVQGADKRAEDKYDAVQVLTAVKQINVGETVAQAQAAGKIEVGNVSKGSLLPGALTSLQGIETQIAQTNIYPGEQIIAGKFGTNAASTNALTIPKGDIAVSINLTDTARVAGFVNPGDKVAIFLTSPSATKLLLNNIEVIAVGTTTVVSTTTTDSTGAQTTEQLPRTLFTLGVTQAQAQKILYASSGGSGGGELAFGLLNDDSIVKPNNGASAGNLFDGQ